ncbi:restriction endonuclease subunit S [Vibrio sp. GLN_5]|uniref:restriction endonuclease subunit S n=1 Tax=unclassified Vibrio TaxID=2614977 RepID=UPI00370B4A94
MSDKQTVKFGDICREVRLTTKDPIADGYERYIGLEHLDSGSLKIKRWGIIAEDNPSFTRVFKRGHILFGKRRPYLKKAAIAEFDGICSGDIIVLEGKASSTTERLLPFLIQSSDFWNHAISTSSGSLSPRTKFKELQKFDVLALDKKEALVDIFENSEFALGLAIDALETAERLIYRMRSEFFSVEGRKIRLSDIADVIMGQSPKGANCFANPSDSMLPLLNGPTEFGEVNPTPVQYTNQITREAPIESVLFCVRGSTTGRMNIADQKYCIGRGLAAISSRKPYINQRYIYHILEYLKDAIFEQAKGAGSTFPNISGNDLKKWELPELTPDNVARVTTALENQNQTIIEIKQRVKAIRALQSCLLNMD